MCLAQITKRMPDGRVRSFPCGKCLECVKKYQNQWSMRLAEEYKDWKYCYFLTLTYSNEQLSYIPLKFDTFEYKEIDKIALYGSYQGHVNRIYDEELGQYIDLLDVDATAEDRFLYVYNSLSKLQNKHVNRLRQRKDTEYVNYLIADNLAEDIKVPIVSRADIQLWLKRVRMAYKRAKNKNMLFKYFLCSEYGPNTFRPHYHMMIFADDLTLYDIQEYFISKWEDTYGRVDWKKRAIDGAQHVAEYVSKYCLKPAVFENPYAVAGLIPRTFRMMSHGIGVTYKENLIREIEELKKEVPVYLPQVEWAFSIDEFETKDDLKLINEVFDYDFTQTLIDLPDSRNKFEKKSMEEKIPYFKELCHNRPQVVNPEFIEALYEKLRYFRDGFFYGMPRYWKDAVFPHTWKEGIRYNKKTKKCETYLRYDKDTEHNISVAYTEYMETRYLTDLQKYEELARTENPEGEDMEIIHRAEVLRQQDIAQRTKKSWQKLYKRYYGQSLKNDL